MTDEPTIIEAVGVAVGFHDAPDAAGICAAMEAAMSQAVTDAYAEGVTDPDEIRARMLTAQEAVAAGWGSAPTAD